MKRREFLSAAAIAPLIGKGLLDRPKAKIPEPVMYPQHCVPEQHDGEVIERKKAD